MKKIPIIAIGMTLGLLSHAQQTIPIDKRSTDTEVVLASSTKDVEYARDAIAQIQQADEDNASNSASDYSVSLPSTGSQQTEDVSSNECNNKLVSCSPNPTQGEMTFTYELEDNCANAYILISDLSGNQEMKIDNLTGMSTVSKNLGGLRSGLHIASLIVNDNVQDSNNRKSLTITRI